MSSAATNAAALSSVVPIVTCADPIVAAIRRLENMTDPNDPISAETLQPVDIPRGDQVGLVDEETGTLVHGSSSEKQSIHATDLTPLETSLLYFLQSPTTMRPEFIHDIADDNNPRRLRSEKEKAAYWVRTDGTPLLLSFPAILDTQGKYGRTGPYFNMIENADESNFKRTKALFELRLIRENDPLYPPDAQVVSAATWMLLTMLRAEVEEKRNLGLTYEQRAAVTEFWRAQDVLVVTSDPLFEGMGDPSKIETPRISRSQLGSRAGMLSLLKSPGSSPSTVTPLSSPSKASSSKGSSGSAGSAQLSLQTMPDPYGRYANLMARHPHLKSTTVNPPTIRDQNGTIIHPSDYSIKLGKQTPVFITVKLRLWEISPQSEEKRATSGYKSREGEENGSRIYQLVLHEMSLLPSNVPAHNLVPRKSIDGDVINRVKHSESNGEQMNTQSSIDVGKGKKRVLATFDSDNGDGGMQKKIRLVAEDGDVEMTDNDVFA